MTAYTIIATRRVDFAEAIVAIRPNRPDAQTAAERIAAGGRHLRCWVKREELSQKQIANIVEAWGKADKKAGCTSTDAERLPTGWRAAYLRGLSG